MDLDMSQVFGVFIAVLGAVIVWKYLLEPRMAQSLSPAQKQLAYEPPQTVDEYVKRKYPNAY